MTDNRTTELLPCPWCGEYPKLAEDGGSTGPWFCVWHDCPPVEGGKARHYGESLGCISITTAWFHAEAGAIAAWNTRAELGSESVDYMLNTIGKLEEENERLQNSCGTLTAEQVEKAIHDCSTYASYDGCTYYASGIRLQAIADELNELGSGTCENTQHDADFMCSVCGKCIDNGRILGFNFCPNCGKRVSA